jgi:hypothetical protein
MNEPQKTKAKSLVGNNERRVEAVRSEGAFHISKKGKAMLENARQTTGGIHQSKTPIPSGQDLRVSGDEIERQKHLLGHDTQASGPAPSQGEIRKPVAGSEILARIVSKRSSVDRFKPRRGKKTGLNFGKLERNPKKLTQ